MITDKELRMLQSQYPTENDPMPFAREVIAAYEAKLREQAPVAYMADDEFGIAEFVEAYFVKVAGNQLPFPNASKVIPLFEHPAPIPEGMVLVPIEPTKVMKQKMLMALLEYSASDCEELSPKQYDQYSDDCNRVFKAMLAAARSGE